MNGFDYDVKHDDDYQAALAEDEVLLLPEDALHLVRTVGRCASPDLWRPVYSDVYLIGWTWRGKAAGLWRWVSCAGIVLDIGFTDHEAARRHLLSHYEHTDMLTPHAAWECSACCEMATAEFGRVGRRETGERHSRPAAPTGAPTPEQLAALHAAYWSPTGYHVRDLMAARSRDEARAAEAEGANR